MRTWSMSVQGDTASALLASTGIPPAVAITGSYKVRPVSQFAILSGSMAHEKAIIE
ncbi:MAG: hypothetical protein M5U09_21835 [Gammaproteobacteria bacterium]|nr:hypothetical protein [Gammaproteobacteria bacterium]